jgi:D-glycero-D-manno-heptose 1,7-bisphosphate phosphatase
MAKRAVFLDRDGVINACILRNGKPHPPDEPSQVEILPGVAEGMKLLKERGFLLVVATNQPDVARGTQTLAGVEAINAVLAAALPIDEIRICCHDNADGCQCRKPRPGMILAAAKDFGVDLASSFMVGDRWSDIAAGSAAGCRTILIARPYSEIERCRPTWQAEGLGEAAKMIVGL